MANELKPGMVQCEVTGQWLPEDEVVTIQGMRVGSEGKQILLDKLKSGAALPGEMETPSGWRRFGAMFLDNILLSLVTWSLMFAISMAVLGGVTGSRGAEVLASWLNVFAIMLGMVYFTLMHGNGGQSVGKKMAKLKVIRSEGGPIDYRIALIRSIGYHGPALVGSLIAAAAFTPGLSGLALVGGVVSGVAGLYILVSAIMALLDKSKQLTFHDRIARTRVIRLSM